ncbi:MAG: hypothetical protein RL748_3309 [Pseudomonadota bacterium]|jgi:hypothetical protein
MTPPKSLTPQRMRLADVTELFAGSAVPDTCLSDQGTTWLVRETDVAQWRSGNGPLYWAQATLPEPGCLRYLEPGDVIFHPQYPRHAMLFDLPFTRFVASAPLMVCRINGTIRLRPGYVAWFLGTDQVKAALFDMVRSKRHLQLDLDDFRNLHLPCANIDVQREIEQGWREEMEREQSVLGLFGQMRQNIDAVLMDWVQHSAPVLPVRRHGVNPGVQH